MSVFGKKREVKEVGEERVSQCEGEGMYAVPASVRS